jgi:hypothetical protein
MPSGRCKDTERFEGDAAELDMIAGARFSKIASNQGLDNALVSADPAISTAMKAVTSRQRLGGLLNFYLRDAASVARS